MRRAAPIKKRDRLPWGWAFAGGLLGLLTVLLVNAPARWLTKAVALGTHQMVQLRNPEGTLWAGSARLVLTGGEGSQGSVALPGKLQWRLGLTWPGVRARIRTDCCTPGEPLDLRVKPRWGGAQLLIADSKTLWPAAVLTGLGTPWNTIQPEGELSFTTQGLSVEWSAGRMAMEGNAELTARHMSSRLSTLKPMGSYRMKLSGGDSPSFDLSTLEGSLRLSGTGQWVGSRLRFSGEASAAPGMEAQLANLLNILGRRQGARAIITLG